MKRGGCFCYLVVCALVVFLSGSALADFVVYENGTKIEKNYAGEDVVRGKVNMSFAQQKNALFHARFDGAQGKSVGLLSALNASGFVAGKEYRCVPSNCKNGYVVEGSAALAQDIAKDVGGEKKVYGSVLYGENVEIVDFRFNISASGSGSVSSCLPQFGVDLFDDKSVEFTQRNYVDELCGEKKFGCFVNDGSVRGEAIITSSRYCENITLDRGPAYNVGAVIAQSGGGSRLNLELFHENGTLLGGRYVDNPQAPEVKVTINYSSEQTVNAWACVSDPQNSGSYRIRVRDTSDSCGMVGKPQENLGDSRADYEIFAYPLKYASIGKMSFTKEVYERTRSEKMVERLNVYLRGVYNANCTKGCIIPLAIDAAQDISINDVNVRYKKGGVTLEEKMIARVGSALFLIDAMPLVIDIHTMGFVVPSVNGSHAFVLEFDDGDIAQENINVLLGFNFKIGPRVILVGQATTFSVISEEEIARSTWRFGDGSSEVISEGKTAPHRYAQEGSFTVEVSVQNKRGVISAKRFSVVVGEAKRSANVTLNRYEERIANVKKDLEQFPTTLKNDLMQTLELSESESSVRSIRSRYNLLGANAKNEEYITIINSLIDLEVPPEIAVGERGTLPASIGYGSVDVSYLEEISGTAEGSTSSNVRSSVLAWMEEHYDVDISFETIHAVREDEQEILARKYSVELRQKLGGGAENAYLIINQPLSSTRFLGGYSEKPVGQGRAVSVLINEYGEPRSVSFFILGANAPRIEQLGIVVAPELQRLGSELKPLLEFYNPRGEFQWKKFLIALSVLIFVLLSIYIALQEWYKRRYERHLFKNSDDLYNVINFVYNSRRAGMSDVDIRTQLLARKWKREQITYAFRKIEGKRTGMWEIPLFKFVENRKVRAELTRKQQRALDVRFIKRPYV